MKAQLVSMQNLSLKTLLCQAVIFLTESSLSALWNHKWKCRKSIWTALGSGQPWFTCWSFCWGEGIPSLAFFAEKTYSVMFYKCTSHSHSPRKTCIEIQSFSHSTLSSLRLVELARHLQPPKRRPPSPSSALQLTTLEKYSLCPVVTINQYTCISQTTKQ